MMTHYAKLYMVTLLAFLVIDGIWLGLIARGFYGRYLGYLLKPNPNWPAALLFYLLFVGGVVLFVVAPASPHGSWKRVLVYGAVFGLVTYATYDLTNLATIKDWPFIVTVVDLAWGMSVSAIVSLVGFSVGRLFL